MPLLRYSHRVLFGFSKVSRLMCTDSGRWNQATKKGILQRLKEGVVVGDGSFVWTLEKRGYVAAGPYTPEAAVLYPDAVRQLHRDFLRAGSDVMQTFTFYSSDDKLKFQGSAENARSHNLTTVDINNAACDLARQVADEGDALVAGGLSPVPGYTEGKGKDFVQGEFRKQCNVFREKGVDFLLGEFFSHVVEAEWAIEVMKELQKPVACTMRMNCTGDVDGISAGDVAVRMTKAGADIVGINCAHDPSMALKSIGVMKAGLESAGLKPYLMLQPVGFHTRDAGEDKLGWVTLPEYPLAMEARSLTRFDVQTFTRKAYEMGVRYIGGCCGFEPYHIRAIAEELAKERGTRPPGADMNLGMQGLKTSTMELVSTRATMDYWMNLNPCTGREEAGEKA